MIILSCNSRTITYKILIQKIEFTALSAIHLLNVDEGGLSFASTLMTPLLTKKAMMAMDLHLITVNGSSLMFTLNEVPSFRYNIFL